MIDNELAQPSRLINHKKSINIFGTVYLCALYDVHFMCIPVNVGQLVDYFHSLGTLQIMELSSFIGFGDF